MGFRILWRKTLLLGLVIALVVVVGLAATAPIGAQTNETCFSTTELAGGQGFSASGLGFSASGLGFSVSGLGFSASGLGFSASGLGVTPEEFLAEITDPDNRVDSQAVIKLLPDIVGGLNFGEHKVAFVIVDDFGDGDISGPPASDDPHGKKVADVAQSVIDELVIQGAIPENTIEIFPVNINDGTVDYQVDLITPLLSGKIDQLIESSFTHIVINLSLAIWPCNDTINLDDGPVDFDFQNILDEVQSVPDNDPTQVTNHLECVSDYGDDRLIAHFGFENNNGSPIVIPPGDDNALIGGGLDDITLEALTPFYFARPNVVDGQPGLSAPFPNSAFQVPFDPAYELSWTLNGNTVTASNVAERCLVPEGYGFMQYFREELGLNDEQIAELLLKLGEKGSDLNALSDLRTLLAELLDRSRLEEEIAVIPMAASGNSRYLFPQGTNAPPFSPASMTETIATSALLGDHTSSEFWRASQDGNIAVPGGTFELIPDSGNLYIGTSFATPLNSVIAALWLTYPDACTFDDNGRPPVNLDVADDYVNATYPLGEGDYPLNCAREFAIEVDIDFKPGNDQNTFNPGEEGTVTTAILSDPEFYAPFVDPTTILLADAPVRTIGQNKLDAQTKDVNGDGLVDLLLQFNTDQMTLSPDMVEIELTGNLDEDYGGTPIHGVDGLNVVPTESQTASLLALPNGSTSVFATPTLTWSPAAGGFCYLIEIDDRPNFKKSIQVKTIVDAESYTTDPLDNDTYYWRVQVGGECEGIVEGPWSETWSFTIQVE